MLSQVHYQLGGNVKTQSLAPPRFSEHRCRWDLKTTVIISNKEQSAFSIENYKDYSGRLYRKLLERL